MPMPWYVWVLVVYAGLSIVAVFGCDKDREKATAYVASAAFWLALATFILVVQRTG